MSWINEGSRAAGSISASRNVLRCAWRSARRNDEFWTMYWCRMAAELVVRVRPPGLREPSPSHSSQGSWWGLYHDTREEIVNIVQTLRPA